MPYSRRKDTKKNEHTQVSSQLFAKKIDLSICNRLLLHNRSLLIIVYATVIAKGVTDLANNCELLEYGLHWECSNSEEGPTKWEVASKLQNSLIH